MSYISKSAGEVIEIVNDQNEVLTPCTRAEMRKNKLTHRATYAFIKNSNNYFYVQKRSDLKDYCPGFYDPTPGGVVAAGESYEYTNAREIEEEMGIPGNKVNMEHLFTFYHEDERIKCFGDAWECTYDGPLVLQRDEVSDVKMLTMREILEGDETKDYEFTPDSIVACKKYFDMKGSTYFEPTGPHTDAIFTFDK